MVRRAVRRVVGLGVGLLVAATITMVADVSLGSGPADAVGCLIPDPLGSGELVWYDPCPGSAPAPSPSPRPSPSPSPSPVPVVPSGQRDTDGDGVRNDADNCDDVANPDQANLDGDADGDACDGDIDGDGLVDFYDPDPRNPDVDADSVTDGDPTELEDVDGDGNLGLVESRVVDTDGDGVNDEADPVNDDPCQPDDTQPSCDPDGDGVSNAEETKAGTGPMLADTDGDGVDDGDDLEPLSDAGADVDADGVTVTTEPATTVATEVSDDAEVAVAAAASVGGGGSSSSSWLPIGLLALLGACVAGFVWWFLVFKRRKDNEEQTPATA